MNLTPYAPKPDDQPSLLNRLIDAFRQSASMTDETLNSPLGRTMVPAYGAVTRAIPWAFDRLQQPIFRGAQEGANARANQETAMTNAGIPAPISGLISQYSSIPNAVAGAAKGLVGYGKNVRGENLMEGTDLGPRAQTAVGLGLDAFADPLTILTGGLSGLMKTMSKVPALAKLAPKVSAATAGEVPVKTGWEMAKKGAWEGLDSTIGRWDRTAQNLPGQQLVKGKLVNDPRMDLLEKGFPGVSKYDLNVPARVEGGHAIPIATERPAWAEQQAFTGRIPFDKDAIGGGHFTNPLDKNTPGIVTYMRDQPGRATSLASNTQQPSLFHEYGHDSARAMNAAGFPINDALERLLTAFPKQAEALMNHPAYKGRTPATIGEEIINRWPGKALQKVDDPLLRMMVDRAQRFANRPEMRSLAPRYPLTEINSGLGLYSGMKDDWQ